MDSTTSAALKREKDFYMHILPSITNTRLVEILALSTLLRSYQRQYFKHKSPYLLKECKQIEARLDATLMLVYNELGK